MTQRKPKARSTEPAGPTGLANKDAKGREEGSETSPSEGSGKVSRHVQPLGPRILVRLKQHPAQLASGLFLPDTARDRDDTAMLGEVVEVARTTPKTTPSRVAQDDGDERDADLGENVSGVPVGASVLFLRERAVKVPWDETLRLLEVRHVLAVVEEIHEDQLQ